MGKEWVVSGPRSAGSALLSLSSASCPVSDTKDYPFSSKKSLQPFGKNFYQQFYSLSGFFKENTNAFKWIITAVQVDMFYCPNFTGPLKAVLWWIYTDSVKSKYWRTGHSVCLWECRPARIMAPLLWFPVELLETCAAQIRFLLAIECPCVGKWCFDIVETVCGKVSILTAFQRRHKAFQLIETFVLTFIIQYKSLKVLSIKLLCQNIMMGHRIIVLLFWL